MADRAWEYGSIVGPYEMSAQIDIVEAPEVGLTSMPTMVVWMKRDGAAKIFTWPRGYVPFGIGPDVIHVRDLDEFVDDLIELRKFARAHFIANDVRKGRE